MDKVTLIEIKSENSGFTATSPLFPELVTCGKDLRETIRNLQDALGILLEIYQNQSMPVLE